MSDPKQVLLVGPSWVGDMVMAHVLVQMLRRRYPRLVIDLLAPGWAADLGARMPGVREVHKLRLGHGELGLVARWRLAQDLKSRRYDWALVLPNSWKAALIPYWAKIPRRTGYRGEWRYGLLNDRRRLDKQAQPRTIDRFVKLGLARHVPVPTHLPAPRLSMDPAEREAALQKFGLTPPGRPLLALAPGAEFGPAKRWPVRHYQALAQRLLAEGWAVWLFGSPNDAPVTRAIAEAAPGAVDLGGRTSLLEALDLLSLADVTVSNDSGLMHVAGAVGSRVLGLFGSSDPVMTPPLGPDAQILRRELPCSPCGKRECPLKHHHCLEELAPEEVAAAIGPRPGLRHFSR